MRVTFVRHESKGRLACSWEALRGKRTRVPGPYMGVGRDLPHDLAQYVVEAAAEVEHGFWGLLAKGATYRSTGRKRTKPGRAVIAEHRPELIASEQIAGAHLGAWKAGEGTPVTAALARVFDQWRSMGDGDALVFEWPEAVGTVVWAVTLATGRPER